MYCITCGNFVGDHDRFCANCGVAVSPPDAPVKEQVAERAEQAYTRPEFTSAPFAEREESEGFNALNETGEVSEVRETPEIQGIQESQEPSPEPPASFARNSFFDETEVFDAPLPEFPTEPVNDVPMSPSGYEQRKESEPEQRANAREEQTESYFFGKNAFVLCLILIGVLSVTAAMFAGLYLNEIGGIGRFF